MCLISLHPSTEASIAQVLMRHLLLRTSEKTYNTLTKKKVLVFYTRQKYWSKRTALILNFDTTSDYQYSTMYYFSELWFALEMDDPTLI